ncbi:hypothetical protein [Streptomyces jumonjinensis]
MLPAVTDVDVVPVPLVMSDHHVLRLILDGDLLADILNRQPVGSPSFAE